jgi:glycosyltransferase involved in cell wall biosynthesis
VCCGTGGELARLDGALAAASNVKHVACVTDVPGLLGAADLLVLCSEEEAAPMVLLEALACGLPFVSTEVPGVRGLLAEASDPVPGWLVPVRQPAALAAALERALAEVGRARDELRSSARALAERHGWARPWARYRELYGV